MNTKMKRRLIVVTGVIIIVVILVLAFVGSSSAAKTITVQQAVSGEFTEQRVQVTGNVVKNSYRITDSSLVFDIYDPDGDPDTHLQVVYDGAASATFGNDVTAISTGRIKDDGILYATELVTKCPSKYESATDALGVAELLDYGSAIFETPVKVTGIVKAGSLGPAGQEYRFILVDTEQDVEVTVAFDDALPENIAEGEQVVATGLLKSATTFAAAEVALKS